MTPAAFFTQLAAVTALAAALITGLDFVPLIHGQGKGLAWAGLVVFLLISILMYFVGKQSATSRQLSAFTGQVMVFSFIKMMLAVFTVVLYHRSVQPTQKYFVLPFLGVYILYTIFETYFLMRLAKSNRQESAG